MLLYDKQLYQAVQDQLAVTCLVPSLDYTFEVPIQCSNPAVGPDAVRVLVATNNSCVPMLSARINMPMSEFEDM